MMAKYKAGKPEINVCELPAVPSAVDMEHLDYSQLCEHYIDMLAILGHEHPCATWGIQMIAELGARWIDAVDRLHSIEKIVDGLNVEGGAG